MVNKGLTEKDKKEGLLKSVWNIGDKNEGLLKTFIAANKVSKAAKNESDFNYNSKYAFYRFTETQKFNGMVSIDSKHGELEEFYELLSDFKNHKPITIETKNRKNRIMNNVNRRYDSYYDSYKNNYDSEDLNEKNKLFFDPNQFKIFGEKNKNQNRLKKILRDGKAIMVWNK